MSKMAKRNRKREKIAAWQERRATRSTYAAKKFEQTNGRAPRQDALANARKK